MYYINIVCKLLYHFFPSKKVFYNTKDMERIYQERIETIINNTLNQILIYGLVAFTIALILEGTMPRIDDEKDIPSLVLEVFVQLTITVAFFVGTEMKIPGRYGILAFIIITLAAQKNFIEKILILTSRIFGEKVNSSTKETEEDKTDDDEKDTKTETNEENETIYVDNNAQECTPIDSIPMY